MNCAECRERLVAWVEGLLDEPERQSVGHHLEACAACRDELDAITALYGRLVDEGRSYRNREAADAVMARILREQQFKLRRVEPAPGRLAVRRFVMNRFGKLAVAAVLLAAVGLGALLFQETATITLAEVAERLQKIESFVYRGRVTIAGVPGMAAGQKMETETRTVFSARYGMRMDASVDGQVVSKTYVDPAAGLMISVMPTQKRYTKFTFTPQMLEDARRKNADPRKMVQEFLKAGYTDLGSRTVNGVEQRGFECRQVGLSAGMGDNAVGEIWVDTRTGLVVEMTIRGRLADGQIEVVCNDFEWNVPCEAEDFAVEIPADYQRMDDFNVAEADSGEQLVEGLRFWADLSGGKYPKSLATTSLAQEMREIAHPEAGAAASPEGDAAQYMLEFQTKMLKLRVGAAHFTMLEATGRDAAYYGQTVKPGQADKVLARWKDDAGTYTVIFGDLRIETKVSPQRLAELEQPSACSSAWEPSGTGR